MSNNTRSESDSIGTLEVPSEAYYGVQTLRGFQNFQITGHKADDHFVKNIVRIKKASAIANGNAGAISSEISVAIQKACDEALEGKFDQFFITDGIQGGAGTSFNMNVNEVIANRATELLGGVKGQYICHPNDHVNCAQSTNDVIPTAGKLTVIELTNIMIASLDNLISALEDKAKEFDGVLKMGRTQLQDAVPIRLGQEFSAYVSALKRGRERVLKILPEMKAVNMGGTAIGTAINAKKVYLDTIASELSKVTGYDLYSCDDLIDGTQNVESFSAISGALKALAITLSKMSNDFRLMASGPKDGLSEIILPAKQNGSSIMPGKINPVIPEVMNQVAFVVIGNDVTITMAAEAGQLELNAFEPVMFTKLFESLECMANAMNTLTVNCVVGIVANEARCAELLNASVGIVTALCPYIGYKKSAELAKEALKRNMPIRKLIVEKGIMTEEELSKVLDPFKLTNRPEN